MKILITGVAGFIGSKLAEAATKKGYEVVGIDDLSQGFFKNVPKSVRFFDFDLTKKKHVNKLPTDIDYVLHLAGQSSGEISFDNPILDLEKNAISTLNLIKFCIRNNVRKILYASSMSVYGDTDDLPVDETNVCSPVSCYGVGKLAAENYLKIYKDSLPYIIFRMFNVYGPGQNMDNVRQGMVSIYLTYILRNGHVPVKGKVQRFRDFIYIDDVVNIWLQAIEMQSINNEKFNLGTGVRTTIFELLNKIKKIIPNFTWLEVGGTPGDQFGVYADTRKIKNFFNSYDFVSLDEGLLRFIEWLQKKNI